MVCQNKSITLLVIGIVLVTMDQISCSHSQKLRSGFDQPCNKTLRCKSQSWLRCDHETEKCRCVKQDEMVYDLLKEKCVALIGERCKFGLGEDVGTEALYERAECVRGSVCGPSGICSCLDGFYEDIENSQCSPVKDHGGFCESKYECNQDKFLSCVEGKCQCDLDNAIYNHVEFYEPQNSRRVPNRICIGRVGSRCSRYTEPQKYCVVNSFCSSNSICQCTNSYAATSERLCGLGYNKVCSDTSVCSDKLICTGISYPYDNNDRNNNVQEVRCKCPQQDYQSYDEVTNTCRGFVGSPCDPNDSLSCVDKAVCIERDNMFQCECDEGFVDTLDSKCQISFGHPCNYIDQRRQNPSTRICDEFDHLQCKRGKCSCKNDADQYEPMKRKCSTPLGLRCQNVTQCVDFENAQCIKSSGNLWGRCARKEVENEDQLSLGDDYDTAFNQTTTTTSPNTTTDYAV